MGKKVDVARVLRTLSQIWQFIGSAPGAVGREPSWHVTFSLRSAL